MRLVFAKEASEGPNAQDRAERLMAPPPRGRDCSPSAEKYVHMVSAMEVREGPIIHLSSVFMTNGRADTPAHSVLGSCRFRVPAFDQRQHDLCGYCHLYMINMTWISNLEVYFQRWCWRLAYAFCYVGRLVFVARGRPLSQEKPLDKLCCCLSAETRPHDVGHGSTRGSDHSRWDWASHGGESPPLRGHHGTSSNTQCAFRQLWKKYGGVFIKLMCIELAMEAREGPDPEDKAEFHMAATGHLFEDLMATCHPPSIPDEVACKPSHTSGPSDSFGGNMMSTSPAVCT